MSFEFYRIVYEFDGREKSWIWLSLNKNFIEFFLIIIGSLRNLIIKFFILMFFVLEEFYF